MNIPKSRLSCAELREFQSCFQEGFQKTINNCTTGSTALPRGVSSPCREIFCMLVFALATNVGNLIINFIIITGGWVGVGADYLQPVQGRRPFKGWPTNTLVGLELLPSVKQCGYEKTHPAQHTY